MLHHRERSSRFSQWNATLSLGSCRTLLPCTPALRSVVDGRPRHRFIVRSSPMRTAMCSAHAGFVQVVRVSNVASSSAFTQARGLPPREQHVEHTARGAHVDAPLRLSNAGSYRVCGATVARRRAPVGARRRLLTHHRVNCRAIPELEGVDKSITRRFGLCVLSHSSQSPVGPSGPTQWKATHIPSDRAENCTVCSGEIQEQTVQFSARSEGI